MQFAPEKGDGLFGGRPRTASGKGERVKHAHPAVATSGCVLQMGHIIQFLACKVARKAFVSG